MTRHFAAFVMCLALVGPRCSEAQGTCWPPLTYRSGWICKFFADVPYRQETGVCSPVALFSSSELAAIAEDAYEEWTVGALTWRPSFEFDFAGQQQDEANWLQMCETQEEFNRFAGTTDWTAVTFPDYGSQGALTGFRIYINPIWNWQPDCSGGGCGQTELSLKGTLVHEFGHVLGFDDVAAIGCDDESVMFWDGTLYVGTAFREAIKAADALAVNYLYGITVDIGTSLWVAPGPSADTLHWSDSDPSESHTYRIRVSDSCWGPYGVVGDVQGTAGIADYTYVVATPFRRPYYYSVWVMDTGETALAESDRTTGIVPTPVEPPTGLVAEGARPDGAVTLTWHASAGVADGYYVHRSSYPLEACGQVHATFGPIVDTTWTDTGAPRGELLSYRVRAFNSTGSSDVCDLAAVRIAGTVAREEGVIIGCPQGDADSVCFVLQLYDGGTLPLRDDSLKVIAVRADSGEGNVRVWDAYQDTLRGAYSVATYQARFSARALSGCGRVSYDVYAGNVLVCRGVGFDIRSYDLTDSCPGYVDGYDVAEIVRLMGGGYVECADVTADSVLSGGDLSAVLAHLLHGSPRMMHARGPSGVLRQGQVTEVLWEPTIGGAARASVFLVRDAMPSLETPLVIDCPDTGRVNCAVTACDAPRTDYRIKVVWSAGAWDSNGSNELEHVSTDEVFAIDPARPAAVSDLSTQLGRTTAVVSWTAPGDDSLTGTAAAYDLRYSLYPITGEASFEAATVVQVVPEPSEAGSVECVELYGLTGCHAYYFALKTRDEAYNWSAMSNVASGTTLCSGYQEVLCGGDGLLVQGGSGGGWLLEGSVLGQDAEESAVAVVDAASLEAEVATVGVYEPNEVSSAADVLVSTAVETDTCALEVPAAADSGCLALRLSSKSDATWILNGVNLLGVDHGVEEQVVLAGESALVGTPHALDAVRDSSGSDLAAVLASGQEPMTVQVGSTWDMSVSGVDVGGAALFLEVFGRGAEDGDDARGITILAEDGAEGWRALTTLVPRDGENRLVVDSLPGGHLRLLFHDECTVERLAWLGSCRRVSPEELDLVRAEHSEAGSVFPADGGETDLDVTLGPGENLVLTYDVPAVQPDQARDFFLVVRGRQEKPESPAVALSTAAATPRPMALPAAFALHQNQPNPFSGTTTVRFDLPVASTVDVSIFDLQGRHVHTLANGDFAAGFQSVVWDHRDDAGNSMRPSVYLCRLVAGAFRAQRTMVLLP